MKKKSIIILIIMLAIGFAAVSTTLIINGTIGVQTNSDDFKNKVVFDEESIRKSNNDIVAEVSESGRTLSFTTQTMTSVNETSTVYFKIKNYSQYDATLGTPAISCYFVDSYNVDEKATPLADNSNPYMEITPGTELDGDTILGGGRELSEESSVTVRQIKSSIDNNQEVKFQCEINTTGSDSDTPSIEKPIKMSEGYYLTKDINGNGIANIGDEITVGTESFYVIKNDETVIEGLSKYNLNVGSNKNSAATEGIQDETVRGWLSSEIEYGNVRFSQTKNWDKGEPSVDIKNQTDGAVRTALYGEDGESGYQSYIRQTIRNANVRLIEKRELEELGCSSSSCLSSEKSWLYSASYWTQSASSSNDKWMWLVNSIGYFDNGSFDNVNGCGVRPVITISKT